MQTATCSNPTATSLTACALRGDVGCTTRASGALSYAHEISETAGSTIASNAHIYGPFEAGFSAQQDNIISNWGCSPASLAYDTAGGLDLGTATAKGRLDARDASTFHSCHGATAVAEEPWKSLSTQSASESGASHLT